MTKIGILTWYKSSNHGAVLQAYATQNFLEKHGIEAVMLDYDRTVTVTYSLFQRIMLAAPKIINGAYFRRDLYNSFEKVKKKKFLDFVENYLHIGEKYYINQDLDCTLIGSDMVWGLVQGYNPYMYGYNVNTKTIISYAACAGPDPLKFVKKLGKYEEIKQGLSRFDAIGVRDRVTCNYVKKICPEKKVTYTIDPVLLYGFESEKKEWIGGKWNNHKKYLLIYSYNTDFDFIKDISVIKRFANKRNLSIVSCGYYHEWCDENINADPVEFFDMFANAEIVVTDTFHGTVFSIINHKEFVSIERGNSFKLRDLLERCGLSSRLTNVAKNVPEIATNKVDYTKYTEWIKIARERSCDFLIGNIVDAR